MYTVLICGLCFCSTVCCVCRTVSPAAGEDGVLQDTEGQVLQYCGALLLSVLPLQDIHGECPCCGAWSLLCLSVEQ